MVLIYIKSGEWICRRNEQWSFVVDKDKRGRMVTLGSNTLLEQLKMMVCEDFGMGSGVANVEFSYAMVNQPGNAPVIISSDRQVSYFVGYAKKDSSVCLCVTFSGNGVNQKERGNIDLNKEPCDSSNVEDDEFPKERKDYVPAESPKPSKQSCEERKDHVAEDGCRGKKCEDEKGGRHCLDDFVKKD